MPERPPQQQPKKSLLERIGVKKRIVTDPNDFPDHPTLIEDKRKAQEKLEREQEEQRLRLEPYIPLFEAVRDAILNEEAERNARAEALAARMQRERSVQKQPMSLSGFTKASLLAFFTTIGTIYPPEETEDATISGLISRTERSMEQVLSHTEREAIGQVSPTLLLEGVERLTLQDTEAIRELIAVPEVRQFLGLSSESDTVNLQLILERELEHSARLITRKRILAYIDARSKEHLSSEAVKRALDARINAEWRDTYAALGYREQIQRFALLELQPNAPSVPTVENDAVTLTELRTALADALTVVRRELSQNENAYWHTMQTKSGVDDATLAQVAASVELITEEDLQRDIVENAIPLNENIDKEKILAMLLRYGGWKFLFSLPPLERGIAQSSSRLLFTQPEQWDSYTPTRYSGRKEDVVTLVREHILTKIRAQLITVSPKPTLVPDERMTNPAKRKYQMPKGPVTMLDGTPIPDYTEESESEADSNPR